MPIVGANGIDIAYESWGEPDAPAVLLLPGAGRQLIEWPPDFVGGIVAAGYRVIAIDPRDAGLSTHFAGKASLTALRGPRHGTGETQNDDGRARVPYRLDDLAEDAVGVLDGLGVDAAHVVGFSLGGAVAQQMAASHPDRLRSLTSVMASTGNPAVGQPDAAGRRILLRSPPPDRDPAVEAALEARVLMGGDADFDEDRERRRLRRAVERNHDPAGTGRQLAALYAAGDRTDRLATITVPTLVVHGADDRLVDVSGGRATAAAITGARLVVLEGMGHALAQPFITWIVEELIEHFANAKTLNAGS